MPDIRDGESVEMQGSGKKPYVLKNVGGVYSCSCPAWRNQSLPIDQRTCKHLKKYRGETAELDRVDPLRRHLDEIPIDAEEYKEAIARGESKEKKEEPPVLLAHVWENDIDLDGWWISEKLDGVRAWWDGKNLLSRAGNVYHAPEWFLANLPGEPLDGELWMARKSFQATSGIVRRHSGGDWSKIRYRVFDAPNQSSPFEERQKFLYEVLHGRNYVQVEPQIQCKGLEHLRAELARVETLGAEGLMLRQPGSLYESGRSNTLLKVKTFYDSEAVVIDYEKGKGKHKGRLGALVCMSGGAIFMVGDGSTSFALSKGTVFKIGTGFTDAQRNNPPPIGSTVTFRFQELTDDGKPRFSSFVRMYEGH